MRCNPYPSERSSAHIRFVAPACLWQWGRAALPQRHAPPSADPRISAKTTTTIILTGAGSGICCSAHQTMPATRQTISRVMSSEIMWGLHRPNTRRRSGLHHKRVISVRPVPPLSQRPAVLRQSIPTTETACDSTQFGSYGFVVDCARNGVPRRRMRSC